MSLAGSCTAPPTSSVRYVCTLPGQELRMVAGYGTEVQARCPSGVKRVKWVKWSIPDDPTEEPDTQFYVEI